MKTTQKKPELRVAVVQMQSVDDVDTNIHSILSTLKTYTSSKLDLIVLPENSLFLRVRKEDHNVGVQTLKEKHWQVITKAAHATGATILMGITYQKSRASRPHNALLAIEKGKKPKIVYEKIHLFDVDVVGAPPSRESDIFAHGKKPAILNVGGWRIGLSICYDIRFAELYLHYAKKSVDAVVIPAAFLVPTGEAHWQTLVRARAIEGQCYVLAPAQGGEHKGVRGGLRHTYGHSMIVDPWGRVVAEQNEAVSGGLVAILRADDMNKVRNQIPMAQHRRL